MGPKSMGESEADGMKYRDRTREIERPRTGPGAEMRTGSGSDTDTGKKQGLTLRMKNEARMQLKKQQYWELTNVWNRNRSTEGLEQETDLYRSARFESEAWDRSETEANFEWNRARKRHC